MFTTDRLAMKINIFISISLSTVNLHSWQQKLDTKDTSTSAPDRQDCGDDVVAPGNSTNSQSRAAAADSIYAGVYQKFRDGVLTIGCLGWCAYFLMCSYHGHRHGGLVVKASAS